MNGAGGAESLYGQQTLYHAPLGGAPSVFDRQTAYSPHGSQAGGGHLPPTESFYGGGYQQQQQQPYYDNDRPGSTFHQSQYGGGGGQHAPSHLGRPQSEYLPPGGGGGDQPTDGELSDAVRRVLAEADLNAVTKKGVRRELERAFGVDLAGRKDVINRAIEEALLG